VRESRCVFICCNNNNKEGRDEEGMGDCNDFTTTTTPTPKGNALFSPNVWTFVWEG